MLAQTNASEKKGGERNWKNEGEWTAKVETKTKKKKKKKKKKKRKKKTAVGKALTYSRFTNRTVILYVLGSQQKGPLIYVPLVPHCVLADRQLNKKTFIRPKIN